MILGRDSAAGHAIVARMIASAVYRIGLKNWFVIYLQSISIAVSLLYPSHRRSGSTIRHCCTSARYRPFRAIHSRADRNRVYRHIARCPRFALSQPAPTSASGPSDRALRRSGRFERSKLCTGLGKGIRTARAHVALMLFFLIIIQFYLTWFICSGRIFHRFVSKIKTASGRSVHLLLRRSVGVWGSPPL